MTKRVVIARMACISALGHDLASNWQSLCDQRSGIAQHRQHVNDDEALAMEGPLVTLANCDLAPIGERFSERAIVGLDAFSAYALPATLEATDQAGLTGDPCLAKAAIVYGEGASGQSALEDAYQRVYIKGNRTVHPLTIPRFMPSAVASQISLVFGVKGPCFAVSSACSSSAHAIIAAVHMFRSGRINVAIAGGSEAPYTYGHWLAWKAIRAMADDTCRPFSQDRKGMVMGEGAATLVLEERDHALARGATILGEDPDCVLPLVTGQSQVIDAEVLISNTFAIGGLNAVLIGQLH